MTLDSIEAEDIMGNMVVDIMLYRFISSIFNINAFG